MERNQLVTAVNVSIVESPDSSNTELEIIPTPQPPIETFDLPTLQSKSFPESHETSIKQLFGSWDENENDEENLKQLYESRSLKSKSIDE